MHWCFECNLPLLQEKCACGKPGKRIFEGNVECRLASEHEKKLIRSLAERQFSCAIPERNFLLVKTAGADAAWEAFVDGFHFGLLYFDLGSMQWKLALRIDGAMLIANSAKKFVLAKKPKGHVKGKSLKPEFVLADNCEKGPVLIKFDNGFVGCGILRERVKVLDMARGGLEFNPKDPGIGEIVNANLPHLKSIEEKAIGEIRANANAPVNVAFSGGKDSLAVLELAHRALGRVDVIFVDTGIDFPGNREFVEKTCRKYGSRLFAAGSDSFWKEVEKFGPPGKDYRWCCKVCKLAPLSGVIEKNYPDGCVTIDGRRRLESFSRAGTGISESNPFVPGQKSVFPIREWGAFEVWLYIFWRKLEYNPLYDLGFDRLGCYLCPSAFTSELELVGKKFPALYERWVSYLLKWAKKSGLGQDFVRHGFWRWRRQPPKMVELARALGIHILPAKQTGGFSVVRVRGISPCKSGGYSSEWSVRGVDVGSAADAFRLLGKTVLSEELGVVMLRSGRGSAKFFAGGALVLNGEALEGFEADIEEQLYRIAKCTGCGICVRACRTGAIKLAGRKIIVSEKCTHCGECSKSCVLVKYFRRG